MPDHSHHNPYEINAIPWRDEDVHTPKLYDSIDTFSCRCGSKARFSFRIGYREAQSLHIAIQHLDRIAQVGHFLDS